MSNLSRRRFLQSVAASTVFPRFTIAGTKASGRVLGSNDTVRVAIAGIHDRGLHHLKEFAAMPKVQVTHLVDPDSRLFDKRSADLREIAGNTPQCVQDIRRVLDDPNVDAISVATCNHWHALIAIWACQAGKDVYVEKPISHNVFEGRKCVEAAKKYGRVVQHGTQRRSELSWAREIAAVHSEKYGKLRVSKGYCCKPRWSIGFKPVASPPPELDFNLWLGPAAERPYHENLVHYNWHWFWDTGNGDIGNQGAHQMDIARWAIKDATLPNAVWSLGGRFGYDDQGETPNTQLAVLDYPNAQLVFEVFGLVGNKKRGNLPARVDNEFYTTEGLIRNGRFYPHGSSQGEPLEGIEAQVAPGGAFRSFIQAVRSRRPEDNNSDAEVGHYSSALCHLANISFVLGKPASFDKAAAAIGDNKGIIEAFDELSDKMRTTGVKLEESQYTVGRKLQFDPNAEKFLGDEHANSLLTREYRPPFVVPTEV